MTESTRGRRFLERNQSLIVQGRGSLFLMDAASDYNEPATGPAGAPEIHGWMETSDTEGVTFQPGAEVGHGVMTAPELR